METEWDVIQARMGNRPAIAPKEPGKVWNINFELFWKEKRNSFFKEQTLISLKKKKKKSFIKTNKNRSIRNL